MRLDDIRRETGFRSHTIRYALKKLRDRGIITEVPYINICALGYSMYNIYFSISANKARNKSLLTEKLISLPEVLWLAELGSDFHYGMGLCARSIADVKRILRDLSEQVGEIFTDKAVSTQFSVTRFPRLYLSGKPSSVHPLRTFQFDEPVQVDETDNRILSALTLHGGASHSMIARYLGMPLSTLDLRLKKLEQRGVLISQFFQVSSALYGMQSYKLLIQSKGISSDFAARIRKFAAEHRYIVHLVECFGTWDYELGVEVPNAEAATSISQELFEIAESEIYTVKTLTKFRDLKLQMYPAVREEVVNRVANR